MSPFKSLAQKKFMYANHPVIAERWSREFPNNANLPQHVTKKSKPKRGKNKSSK